MNGETDAQRVARVRRGEREGAAALAERYLRACRAVALAVTGDEADADDVCRDAFVSAIENDRPSPRYGEPSRRTATDPRRG